MDYVNFVFSLILNFQNADIEPSKTCWAELRDESEEELTLLLGADFPDSEYPRSRVDQSASQESLLKFQTNRFHQLYALASCVFWNS